MLSVHRVVVVVVVVVVAVIDLLFDLFVRTGVIVERRYVAVRSVFVLVVHAPIISFCAFFLARLMGGAFVFGEIGRAHV